MYHHSKINVFCPAQWLQCFDCVRCIVVIREFRALETAQRMSVRGAPPNLVMPLSPLKKPSPWTGLP
eukprot:1142407-Pelagomonas_calceolata.AAC.7